MGTRARIVRAEHDLVRSCHRGLDMPSLREELLRRLRRLMPVDAAFLATADPQTLLFTGAYSEEPLGAATPLFVDNEFGGTDVNTFAALATSANHVASLDDATRGTRLASPRYRDIMRPLGLGDELRGALVTNAQCWGYVCLHREDGALGFTSSEAGLLARIAPHVAHALRQTMLLHGSAAGPAPAPGVVVLTTDLDVVAITPEAEHLLCLIDTAGHPAGPLPAAVHAAAARLRAVRRGTETATALPRTRVRTLDGGWLDVHASWLHSPGRPERITLVVKMAERSETVPLLLAAHGLSPREAEVATLVLRGASTRVISDTLHISVHTVQDHLKTVFDKTGVRSRRDLIGRLLTAATPGRH